MHISVPANNVMEYIPSMQVTPLISKVLIKVCYVQDEPNRNDTVITKQVATELGRKLPGSAIVGFYNKEAKDFDGHNREIVVEGNEYKMIDMTKPYGFVDINAKAWFQNFIDDNQVERTYLCTEGYVWDGVYEEAKHITTEGNNQSMELDEKHEKGFWTKDENSNRQIFIINEGLIKKLCVLGSNVEPCFEGSQIKAFSLMSPDFESQKAAMFSELNNALNKGGSKEIMENEKNNTPIQEGANEESQIETQRTYTLENIPEYVELQSKYTQLENDYNTLTQEVEQLRTFKLAAERKDKEAMIASFYMLSDEEKKDVVNKIDEYSLDDIEAKLSIICVRNKVDFKMAEAENNNSQTQQFSLNINEVVDKDDTPAWVKAVRQKENN